MKKGERCEKHPNVDPVQFCSPDNTVGKDTLGLSDWWICPECFGEELRRNIRLHTLSEEDLNRPFTI